MRVDRRLLMHFDWVLLLLLIFIGAMSVLNLYSATYPVRNEEGTQIFVKQVYWYLIGFGVLLMMTTFDYHHLLRLAYPAYFFSVILLILVLAIGDVRSGSQRWLHLGGFTFQPAELMKITLVILLAKFYEDRSQINEFRLRDLWQPLAFIAVPCLLIVKEPDLGTALTVLIVSFSVILFAKLKWRSLATLVIGCLLPAPFLWSMLKEYQQRRILIFLNPEMDPLGAGYHINQSKIAIGSGMAWGKGFLKGTQTRLHFLPEQHTDFAFSVLAEEWGFLGAMVLLLLFVFLIFWGLNIAKNSKDKFGALIALGVVSIVFWQLAINVSMATGLIPVVGIPLSLLSYGGSSIISLMAGMGLLMNISMRRFMFQ
jgi:rod shape determining protein RodA